MRGATCFPVCGFPAITDPDGDGYGWERNVTCLVAGSAPATGGAACTPPAPPNLPPPGSGIQAGTMCHPVCASALTDADGDGYGYEHLRTCLVAGTAAALGGVPCAPNLPPLGTGDGIRGADNVCNPLCVNPVVSDPDGDGFGYENMRTCVVSASIGGAPGRALRRARPPDPTPAAAPAPGDRLERGLHGHDVRAGRLRALRVQ